MLKINLLPAQERAKVANVEKEVVLFGLSLLFILICLFLVQQQLSNKVNALENQKESLVNTKNQLQPKIDRIDKVEKKINKIQNRLNVIKKIRKRQSLPVQYLKNLVDNMQGDKIWFNSLQMGSKGDIELSGIAINNQAFAEYVEDLKTTALIQDINIKQTSRKEIKGLNLISFECSIISEPQEQNSTSSGS